MITTLALSLLLQAGDHADDVAQIENWREWEVPSAPVLSAEEELASFKIADGFVIELVAAEPLVVDPVAACFDQHGRLWVVEMRGFMPDVDGRGEDKPVGKIVVLEDSDGDGRMDRSTAFLEDLVLPRALSLVDGGLLVLAPPYLLFCQDLDGDLRSDRETIVSDGWSGIYSPEHAPNGLIRGLDNRLHFAGHNQEAAWQNGTWQTWPASAQGQWGVSKDDLGSLYFNTNSSFLHADLVPRIYGRRNPGYRGLSGLGVRVMRDQSTWPSRITPGVNRGYRPATLRDDGTLATATGACGPGVVRGSAFAASDRGSVLIPEPCANLVKRVDITRGDGRITATNAHSFGIEFLTSSDERFRPVNVIDGPDGATYVLDFYRGLLQHRLFVTSYLRKQILHRGLDTPIGLGRIWRVRAVDHPVHPLPAARNPADWLSLLGHPDGFWRDTAQRLLVDSQDVDVADSLRGILRQGSALASVHALWTLHGRGELDPASASWALEHFSVEMVSNAIRASEDLLPGTDAELSRAILKRCQGANRFLRRQALLSLLAAGDELSLAGAVDLFFGDLQDGVMRSALPTVPPAHLATLLKLLQSDSRLDLQEQSQRKVYDDLVASAKADSKHQFESPVYRRACAACHGTDGYGQAGLAPPLNDPNWLGLPQDELIGVVLDGISGQVEVSGVEWNLSMPGWRHLLKDEEVAEVLTAIQKRFATKARAFTAAEVAAVRAAGD
ncbi:MAG: hypothetical protein COB96_06615 [Planctomycetota bacterium]|nr:MAG: hypothetical protein COB96_06615 [Planctomycetota bacterium]